MRNDEIEKWLKTHSVPDKDAHGDGMKRKNAKIRKRFGMIIDLHGMRLKMAERMVMDGLRKAYKLQYEKILVIHGVGLHSEREPVLKYGIRKLLKTSSYVIDFSNAQAKDGGEGATVVYLRRK